MEGTKSGDQPESIRRSNRRLLLDLVRSRESVTTGELAEATGLSRTTVLKAVDYLRRAGVVEISGKGAPTAGGGKPPALYRYDPRFGYAIVAHVLGERVNMAVADASASLLRFVQEPIPADARLEVVIGLVARFVETAMAGPECRGKPCLGIVVASSGVVDRELGAVLSAAHFPSWGLDAPLRGLLAERVGDRVPIFVDNYNRFATYAEYARGAARGRSSVVGIFASWDGLGAGIISEGRLLYGPKSLAGEIGHLCINPQDEEACHCGGRGCFERQVSIQSLLARADRGAPGGAPWDLHSLLEAYRRGEGFAEAALDEAARWMAIGIANVNLALDPEVFVLSGAYRGAGEKFARRVAELAERVSMTRMPKGIEVAMSGFGDEGAVVGGALYAIDRYFQGDFEF